MKTFLKKNKAALILPLALIPFVVLIFYILGGGEKEGSETDKEVENKTSKGINYILPEAESSIEIFDKMDAYQKNEVIATQDYDILGGKDSTGQMNEPAAGGMDSLQAYPALAQAQNLDGSTNLLEHIKQKEESINKELSTQDENTTDGNRQKSENGYQKKTKGTPSRQAESNKPLIQEGKHEQAGTNFNYTGIGELDKVFDENLVLNRQNDSLKFYLLQTKSQLSEIEKVKNASFSLDKKQVSVFNKRGEQIIAPLKAEIYETETVLDGNRVKLRLLEDAQINGLEITKNSFVYGICKINNERLHIEITQLPVGESFLPVKLSIHDLDGLPGLYVPDNAARKVTKEVGASTNTSSMFGVSNDPLAYAGIRALDRTAQTLLKSVRLKRVTVKKNTLVYLINE
jgi:conjugative transposon TraM protein